MKTFTGRIVDPFNLQPVDIDILDIAHALSNLCRFGGHCAEFYSVAEHSVAVAELCPGHRLAALLHDASEAYLTDVPRPLKYRQEFAWYREVEKDVQARIYSRFGLAPYVPAVVKKADDAMCVSEGVELMNELYTSIGPPGPPLPKPLPATEAKRLFLGAFRFCLKEQAQILLAPDVSAATN